MCQSTLHILWEVVDKHKILSNKDKPINRSKNDAKRPSQLMVCQQIRCILHFNEWNLWDAGSADKELFQPINHVTQDTVHQRDSVGDLYAFNFLTSNVRQHGSNASVYVLVLYLCISRVSHMTWNFKTKLLIIILVWTVWIMLLEGRLIHPHKCSFFWNSVLL